jgi:hypothetical protein
LVRCEKRPSRAADLAQVGAGESGGL